MNQRTLKQNKALHKFYELLADTLNDAGKDMKAVLKPEIDIPWTPLTVKEYLWKPLQDAYLKKKSTTELTTDEVSKVWEVLNRYLGDKHGVHVPFPSDEESMLQDLDNTI